MEEVRKRNPIEDMSLRMSSEDQRLVGLGARDPILDAGRLESGEEAYPSLNLGMSSSPSPLLLPFSIVGLSPLSASPNAPRFLSPVKSELSDAVEDECEA